MHAQPADEEVSEFVFDLAFQNRAKWSERNEACDATVDFVGWPEEASAFCEFGYFFVFVLGLFGLQVAFPGLLVGGLLFKRVSLLIKQTHEHLCQREFCGMGGWKWLLT